MADKTGIAWSGYIDDIGEFIQGGTLNIAGGCDKCDPACDHCYAIEVTARLNRQLSAIGDFRYDGLVQINAKGEQDWTGKIVLFPERLEKTINKQRGQAWFTSSLTDVFHRLIPDEFLFRTFGMMVAAQHHRFYVLSKRPRRMVKFLTTYKDEILEQANIWCEEMRAKGRRHIKPPAKGWTWPVPNIWPGTSTANQKSLDKFGKYMIPLGEQGWMAWLSVEPMLGPVDLAPYRDGGIKWAVFGGESGNGARNMELEWVESGIDQCRQYNITPFVKQTGVVLANRLGCKDITHGADFNEFPTSIQVREFPKMPEWNS